MKRLFIAALLIAGIVAVVFLSSGLFDYLYIRWLLSPFSLGIESINFVNPHIGKAITAAVSAMISFLCILKMTAANTTGRRILTVALTVPFSLASVYHGLSIYGTWGANFESNGHPLLSYEVLPSNDVVYYPSYFPNSPHTGRPLALLTAEAVNGIDARKSGKFTEVKDPQWDDFFARGTPDPRLWYRKLGEEEYRFFNAPAWDLKPVTIEVRADYFKNKSQGEWVSNAWEQFRSHPNGGVRQAAAKSKGRLWTTDLLAWHLATCTVAAHRNSKYALEIARLGVKFDPENPVFLDTLAAALARDDKFQEAADTELKAIKESKSSRGQELPEERGLVQKRLDGYRRHVAYVCDETLAPATQKAQEAAAIEKGLSDLHSHGISTSNTPAELAAGDEMAYNELAWHWATCGNREHIDAQRALQFAQEAVRRDPNQSNYLDTLAAAYAQLGKFEEAISAEQRALQMVESGKCYDCTPGPDTISNRLSLYRSHSSLIDSKFKQQEAKKK